MKYLRQANFIKKRGSLRSHFWRAWSQHQLSLGDDFTVDGRIAREREK
jgi:hypothetical protein